MIKDIAEVILRDGVGNIANEIIAKQEQLRIRDTGASAASLRVDVLSSNTTLTGQLFGFERFRFQDRPGRGPNKSRKPSKQLVEQIRGWVERHGIPDSAAYPIALKIAREGTPVPNPYNPGGVLSEPLDIQHIKEELQPRLQDAIFKEFKSMFFNS